MRRVSDACSTRASLPPQTLSPWRLPPVAAISVVTLDELLAGVLLAKEGPIRDRRRRLLDAVRATFAPIPVDEPVAERYGQLLAVARSQRRTAKATDLLIIATAAAGQPNPLHA